MTAVVAGLVAAVFLIPRISKMVAAATGPSSPTAMTSTLGLFPLVIGIVSLALYLAVDVGLILWSRRQLLSSFRESAERNPARYHSAAPAAAPRSLPPVIGGQAPVT